jgi:hypothetical protein
LQVEFPVLVLSAPGRNPGPRLGEIAMNLIEHFAWVRYPMHWPYYRSP